AFAWLNTPRLDAHPIICPASRIEPVLDAEKSRITQTLGGCCEPFHGPRFAAGKIDIDHHAFRPACVKQLPNELGAMLHGCFPDWCLTAILARFYWSGDNAHGNGGNAEQGSLDGTSNSAGVGYVVGEILAAVDTRQDEIGRLLLQ